MNFKSLNLNVKSLFEQNQQMINRFFEPQASRELQLQAWNSNIWVGGWIKKKCIGLTS